MTKSVGSERPLERMARRQESLGESPPVTPAPHGVDVALFLHVLGGNLGSNIDEWMHQHRGRTVKSR
jgi:hypothetical protein